MAVAYYDIFVFLMLMIAGSFIEKNNKAMIVLWISSLLLISPSAYLFYTSNVFLENEVVDMGGGWVDEDPFPFLVAYFFLIWTAYCCFSFLLSRGLRAIYLKYKKINTD